MAGISPKLPIQHPNRDPGQKLNQTYKEVVKQNFKHLILTIPGERMMDPSFGCGLVSLLFEQYDSHGLRDTVAAKIDEQVKLYMPYIKVTKITFVGQDESVEADANAFRMILEYEAPSLSIQDFLDITV
jgi:phage baseplate assembly protein W